MRDQGLLMPYDLAEWLPEDHLARFIVEIVEKLDFSKVYAHYHGRGSAAYDPRLLLGLLFYGYSTGVFSSRKIEAGTYDSVAFRFISGNHHPDHDTIASFRKRFLGEIQVWFKEILLIGKELGLLKVGNIYIDGTKIQANASRHKAMSYDYMNRMEDQLDQEISRLLERGAAQDEQEKNDQLDLPEELRRRKDRQEKISAAKKAVEARAAERYAREKQEYDQRMQQRASKEQSSGKKSRGKVPQAPENKPGKTDQYNFTDPESRIMKTPRGFDQCYNAQAAVNEDLLILAAYSNIAGNDREEFVPVITAVPKELGKITAAVADAGYFSELNIKNTQGLQIEPIIATSRQQHNTFLEEILNEQPPVPDKGTPMEKMRARLKSKEGAEIYKKRKHTVEPVFGIIKEVLGFRRFSLRGQQNTSDEWSLVCLAYNLKRLFTLSMA